jgi:hypothetical protein
MGLAKASKHGVVETSQGKAAAFKPSYIHSHYAKLTTYTITNL